MLKQLVMGATLALVLSACAEMPRARPLPRRVFDLPPCRGTWICDMDKKHCECLPRRQFEEWKRNNVPGYLYDR